MPTSEGGCEDEWRQCSQRSGPRLARDQHTMHLAISAEGGFQNHVPPYPMLVKVSYGQQCLALIQHFGSLSTVLMEFFFIYKGKRQLCLWAENKKNHFQMQNIF